jgi:hypothetical protein
MLISNGKTTDLRISRNDSISMKNKNFQILYQRQNTNNRNHNIIQKAKKISSTASTTKNNAVNPGVLKGSIM